VLLYVATFPDVGIRCLLPDHANDAATPGLEINQFPNVDPAAGSGDRLMSVNRQPIRTFLDFVDQLAALRSAKIGPGGQLPPGTPDPSELNVPGLIEIYGDDPVSVPERQVEIKFRVLSSARPDLTNRVYVPVIPTNIFDVSLTIVWFVCQLLILAVAMAAYWHRPYDRVAQNFCLMCCASMGAFVGGFHWWILTCNPLLNIPFIICAMLLPAMVLNFFLVFPAESDFVRGRQWRVQALLFGPSVLMTVLLVVVYWSAWCLNGRSDTQGALNAYQKIAVLLGILSDGSAVSVNLTSLTISLLALLRALVEIAICIGSAYFGITVLRLARGLVRIQSPQQRRQVLVILIAALIATIPIGYTMYLAFFRKVDFALGRAQLPMFFASMLFMAAYAHGMLRHHLILADDSSEKSRRYILTSMLVTGAFAMCLASGGVAAHAYNLPLNSSTAQRISLFLILLLATSLALWVRDRLQAVVDRRFFSEKYQLDRTLQQLNRAAGYLADPSGMSEITLRTCQDVIDASSAAMYVVDGTGSFRLIGSRSTASIPGVLRGDQVPASPSGEMVVCRIPSANRNSMTQVQRLLHDLKAEMICFLEDEGGLHGLVAVGRRRAGVAYTAEDIAFLHAIGQVSVLALHSSRANQTMARLNAELRVKVDRIAEQQRQLAILRAELTSLQQDAGQSPAAVDGIEFDREGIRGNSPALLEVLTQVRKVARSTSTVLIRGESGTGKESLARAIHRNSDRAAAPLISVNCAALSSSLLESELFGHVRGAFTGAHADKTGRFQAAHGGTLFLDEIGDISQETQVKLLRVLQERCFEAVGSDKTVHVDVRLIAATNRSLEEMISNGQFREDLYYRLNVVTVTLPPLRARRDDLIELVFFFLSRSSQKARKQIRQIDPEALNALEQHPWPGNIRELENVMERAVLLADSDVITLADLPPGFQQSGISAGSGVDRVFDAGNSGLQFRTDHSATSHSMQRSSAHHSDEEMTAADEERYLREILRAADGNKAQAARRMNLPRSTFYSKCKKYGIL
jgi:transcriptional regulator with PAS, ATPase and Fis domain